MTHGSHCRLLPWLSPEGKSVYLRTDRIGFVSEVADDVEEIIVETGAELLRRTRSELAERELSASESRSLVITLVKALDDALRVAECRGGRLPPRDGGE
jgi:hypothetical protein